MWAFIHVVYLVEFQSRIVVFIKWGIQDLTFARGSRLITETAPTDFRFDDEGVADGSRCARAAGTETRVPCKGSEPGVQTPQISQHQGQFNGPWAAAVKLHTVSRIKKRIPTVD